MVEHVHVRNITCETIFCVHCAYLSSLREIVWLTSTSSLHVLGKCNYSMWNCPFTLLHLATTWNVWLICILCMQGRPLGPGEREADVVDWQWTHCSQIQLHQQLCRGTKVYSIFPRHWHCLRRVQVHVHIDLVSLTGRLPVTCCWFLLTTQLPHCHLPYLCRCTIMQHWTG